MVDHAFRVEKFPHNLHGIDGKHIATFQMVVVLDDILIFSQIWEDHLHHI